MNNLEVNKELNTNNKSGYKTRKSFWEKNHPNTYKKINNFSDGKNWMMLLYNYANNITTSPICNNIKCNNITSFRKYNEGYGKYCSIQCRNTDEKTKKYGLKNPSKRKEVKEKIKSKLFKDGKWSVETDDFKEKTKLTNIKKYGVDSYNKTKKYKEKLIQDNRIKRNGDWFFQTNEFKEKSKNSRIKKYNEELKKSFPNLNITYKYYNKAIIKNYCNIHDEFEIDLVTLHNRSKYNIENICIECNPINSLTSTSLYEKELISFIDSLNLYYKKNDRKILNGKELDVLIPEHNLAIEFNGLYWHSEVFKPNNYHLQKTDMCGNKNIKLLHIFEDEWIHKKNIVKSIIKLNLGLIDNKIYGRKCEIREITSKQSRLFLNNNHIQGNLNSSVRLGLFYNNELVSLMTFGKKRKSLGLNNDDNEYEMYRFCNKLNTVVIGGASKLFKYFIKNYTPKEIISYADRRYFTGEIYTKLGFNYIDITRPNYWYVITTTQERKHRYNYRKNILIEEGYDSHKSEHNIMLERKIYRIYDCGNYKYKWFKPS